MKPLPDYTKSIAPSAVWVPIGEKGSLIVVGGTKEEDDDRVKKPFLYFIAEPDMISV